MINFLHKYICIRIMISKFINHLYSCISVELGSRLQEFVQHHGLSIGTVVYRYTSEEHFYKYLNLLKFFEKYLDTLLLKVCRLYGAFIVYNFVFVPCNLITGTPRPVCSNACQFYRRNCYSDYNRILKFGGAFLKVNLTDNCENTFMLINAIHNFPISSENFEDDCIDIPGMFIYIHTYILLNKSLCTENAINKLS